MSESEVVEPPKEVAIGLKFEYEPPKETKSVRRKIYK